MSKCVLLGNGLWKKTADHASVCCCAPRIIWCLICVHFLSLLICSPQKRNHVAKGKRKNRNKASVSPPAAFVLFHVLQVFLLLRLFLNSVDEPDSSRSESATATTTTTTTTTTPGTVTKASMSSISPHLAPPWSPLQNKQRLDHLNEDPNMINMQHLPTHLVQYQLLTFCTTKTAAKLTQASLQLFTTLKHKIRRTEYVSTERYIQQSQAQSQATQIGIFSSVRVTTLHQLISLITHVAARKSHYPLLYLEIDFDDEPLGNIVFPQTLHTLTFGFRFNQSLDQITLPETLHRLTFGVWFNQALVKLPQNLRILELGHTFNQSLDQVTLPSNLHTLTFGFRFNQSLNQATLPPKLQTLTFRRRFNQSLDQVTLPPTLHTLTFGDDFNQSLDQVTLPPNLHTLTLGNCFNRSLDQLILPPTLHTLTFGCMFNQALDQVTLPSNLYTLTFGVNFNQTLDQVTLPPNLHTLTFGGTFNQSLDQVTLPPTLHTLAFGYAFNQSLHKVKIPPNLCTLRFEHCFNQSLCTIVFPHNIIISKRGLQLAAHLLPPGLQMTCLKN